MSKKEVAQLKEWYKVELGRRDKEIEELKEKNLALLNAAMKQSEKYENIKERLEKVVKQSNQEKQKKTDSTKVNITK